MAARFTIDGSDALEEQLTSLCERVVEGAQWIVPARKLQGIVLGGGYGRGEGGVLKTESGHQPYNDLEFYVFLRGPALWNHQNYRHAFDELSQTFSAHIGLHVEFKMDSVRRFERRQISMFSYDLVSGHRTLVGDDRIFQNCQHHLQAAQIPLSEGTRLLFNRCSGLLLAKEFLRNSELTPEQSDFVARNQAKAQMALGDAVLTVFGQYHWSCLERRRRLDGLSTSENWPARAEIRAHHAAGIEFKLHPRCLSAPKTQFERQQTDLSKLALSLWLWLENRRLTGPFSSARDYALSSAEKCPETAAWRNYLLNVKSFGLRAGLDSMACRYPRERLFNALALLLWDAEGSEKPELKRRLQQQLQTEASDWTGFLSTYKHVWPHYG